MSDAAETVREALKSLDTKAWNSTRYAVALKALDSLLAERDRLTDEIIRRDVVLSWLRKNAPRSIELCPYKLASVGETE